MENIKVVLGTETSSQGLEGKEDDETEPTPKKSQSEMILYDSSTFLKVRDHQLVFYWISLLIKIVLSFTGNAIVKSSQRLLPAFRRYRSKAAKLYQRCGTDGSI